MKTKMTNKRLKKNKKNKMKSKIKNKKMKYDLVVLTRGGGSFQDLFGFSQSELIESIYDFHLPVLSAIGHQVDNPLSDLVSDYTTPTPSLAAQFIVDYNRSYLKNKLKLPGDLQNKLNSDIISQLQKLNSLNERVNRIWFDFNNKKKEELINELYDRLRRLDSLESKLEIYNNKDIMLNVNGKLIQSPEELILVKDKIMEIIWNNVIVKVKIDSITCIK
jgi:exodeoxyribonuclease VII large subunit